MARLFPGGRLVVASHNRGKLAEIEALLAPLGVATVAAAALGLPEPEETETSFVGNARLKALAAATAAGLPALADDSGLEVAALGGAPGIYSARWAGPERDFAKAMDRILADLQPRADRRARFVCALAMAYPDGHCDAFLGAIEGTIAPEKRGDRGFGYDPIFQALGQSLTFGEMEPTEKLAIDHRAIAFRQVLAACFRPR